MSLTCYCSLCHPGRYRAQKTIQQHLNRDAITLRTLNHSADFYSHLQRCINRNTETLEDLRSGWRIAAEGSTDVPMDVGKQLQNSDQWFFYLINK